jgi:hypothetical protein
MEEMIYREDRKIEVFVEKEDTGSNRDLKFKLRIKNETFSFPCLTEGELRKFKEYLDEYFDNKRIMTIGKLRESYDLTFAYYKIVRFSEFDIYGDFNVYISPDAIFKYERKAGNTDKIVSGKVTLKNGNDLVDDFYFYCETLIQILDTQEVEEILGKKDQ